MRTSLFVIPAVLRRRAVSIASCYVIGAAALAVPTVELAHAGGSLLVDDAGVAPDGRCQIESWVRQYSFGQELTAVPACGIGNTEIGIGVSQFFGPSSGPLVTLGAKHVWRAFSPQQFGFGGSVSFTWSADSKRVSLWSLNLPATFALGADGSTLLHINGGWVDTRGVSRGLTAGVGLEHAVDARSTLLAEIYTQHDGVKIGELGIRHALTDELNIDVFVGHMDQVANGPWFGTVGVNFLFR